MGCDIHTHFEIKVDGEWLHYSQANIRRNYRLFEKMAGVRGESKNAISLPRGLPNNLSKITQLEVDYWDTDAHSHSWLSTDEIKEIHKFHEELYEEGWKIDMEQWGYLYGNGWNDFHEFRDSYPEWVEDIRMVFWFDS